MDTLKANITTTCPLPFAGVTGELFLNAVTAIIAAHCTILADYNWPPDNSPDIINKGSGITYDFIIVGAGTAGSLLASHLSNIYPSWKILLIEAGDNPGIDSEIPAFLFLNQNSTNDWFYKTHSDGKSCLGFKNNTCIWSKGKGLGGSSSINAMIYLRGQQMDYAEWEDLGNPGWGYDKLSTYFDSQEKLFDITDPYFEGYENEWYKILDSAWMELGYSTYEYKSHETVIGTKKARLLTKYGKRINTAKTYFMNAKQLHIMKNAVVEKVLIDPSNKKAYGVKVLHKSGAVLNISTTKEIVLSAGSIATPQILMLSGIGPKAHLEEMRIDCLQNLPVGQNLQDHLIMPLYLKTNKQTILSNEVITMFFVQYMLNRSGPFSNIGLTDYMGFIDTTNNASMPNIQFHHTYFAKNDNFVLKPYLEGLGYKQDIITLIEALNHEHDILGIYPTLLHPKSKGEIRLATLQISEPIIKANYFQHSDDILAFMKAIDFVRRLEKTSTFKKMDIKLLRVDIPDCAEHNINNQNYWECYIRHMATTIYHPVGTTKMGKQSDPTSVVNHELLVHGTKNLRVVDASIMPTIPGANTMAATLVIAQKAVDIIKKEYVERDDL